MKIRIGLALAVVAMVVGGCASKPQQPISLAQGAIGAQAGRIGVAMTALPKLDTQTPGVSCLLCLATASIANSSLTTHAKTLPYEDLPALKTALADLLRKKGADVTVIEGDLDLEGLPTFGTTGPNIARKDFTSLRQKHSIDKLLVVEVSALGFIRTYSAYIPTSDPKGLLQGTGYLVSLKDNTYDWYQPVVVTKSAEGKWDEPPSFPGLTNAYFQALEIGKDSFLRPFASDAVVGIMPKAAGDLPPATASSQTSAQSAVQ
jgi:hypothetical protein